MVKYPCKNLNNLIKNTTKTNIFKNEDSIENDFSKNILENRSKMNLNFKKKLHQELLNRFLFKPNALTDSNQTNNSVIISKNQFNNKEKEEHFNTSNYSDDDHVIDYEAIENEDEQNLINIQINEFKNESLPLIESFQFISAKENDDEHFNDSDIDSKKESDQSQNDKLKIFERNENSEEDLKSISSIEGSLKGLSCLDQISNGLNSSTPLIHLYPNLGNLFYILITYIFF